MNQYWNIKIAMRAELLCAVEKFPAIKEKITSLFNDSEEFQALCHDYFLCVKSLGQWEMSVEKDERFLREYKDLKTTLEKDLLQFVDHLGQKHNHDLM